MRASVHLNRFAITRINEVNVCLFKTFWVMICWVRIVQRAGYETSEPGYESSGYERSMDTKRLVTVNPPLVKLLFTLRDVTDLNDAAFLCDNDT